MSSTPVPVAYQKLLEVTRYITAITEPGALFQKLIDTAVEVTGAERGYLLLLDSGLRPQEPLAGLRVAAACRINPEEIERAQFRASRTAILKVVSEGQASHWSGDFPTEWRSQSMELFGLRSILCEPLKVHDRILGVLYLDSQLTAKFSEDHQELLPSFAAQAAICLENLRLISEREEAMRREHVEQARSIELQVYKETLSSFMAIASHDLKGPLTVMKTGLALLKRSKPNDSQQEVISDLDRAVERAARLVSTYLDIQKLEDGHHLRLEPRWVELKPILDEEIAMALAPLRTEQREAFRVCVNVPQGAKIYADPSRLCQIMGNLIENAIKYSPKGGAVELAFRQGEKVSSVRVRDHGLGMSEEGRRRLFDRFVRLEQDRAIRGTGLGLFIVRRLVEAHQGKIEVASVEGQGTSFILHFPNPAGEAPAEPGNLPS
jgi:signal transduction histidine kinase